MSKQKVVVHSILVEHPDLEKKILSDIDANVLFIPNKDTDLFFEEIKDADGIIIADRKN